MAAGRLNVERVGAFESTVGTPYDVTVAETSGLLSFYAAPSFRLGIPIGRAAEIAFDLRFLIVVTPSSPTWQDEQVLPLAEDGVGDYGDEDPVVDAFSAFLAPGLSFRYAL